jgi:ribosomal protein L11 methyltransferase
MKRFIKCQVTRVDDGTLQKISSEAVTNFGCKGSQLLDYNEEQVDKLLGEEAYVGGELPDSILEKIDKAQSDRSDGQIFFFYGDDFRQQADLFRQYLDSLKDQSLHYEFTECDWEDWNSEWKKHYVPIIIADDLKIIPSWFEVDDSSAIRIHPGMGFGTGTHETTFLCLQFFYDCLERYQKRDRALEVLDLGCGSGILGIAAKKFLAADIIFCDIDKDALDNCVENLQLNFGDGDLIGSVVCSREKLKIKHHFDIIFANILEPVLIEELETITSAAKEGTDLFISGLLEEQAPNIISLYQDREWKLIEKRQKKEWVALYFVKE